MTENIDDKLILAWLIPISIIFPLCDTIRQSRFLYLIPMQVITAKTLTKTKKQIVNTPIILAVVVNTVRSILGTLK